MKLVQVAVIIVAVSNASGKDINNTAPSDINPQYLIDVGVKTNDFKLQAIGIAMTNLHQYNCNGWSTWSKCTSRLFRNFGMKQRVRKCDDKYETDLNLCRNKCRSDYEITENGYCIKVHSSPKLRREAENQCLVEGGHLVKVNSQKKYDDIKKMKLPKNFPQYFHIGGERKDLKSPWIYQDGTEITYFKWANNEPSKKPHEPYLFMETIPMAMLDAEGRNPHPYLCEVNV